MERIESLIRRANLLMDIGIPRSAHGQTDWEASRDILDALLKPGKLIHTSGLDIQFISRQSGASINERVQTTVFCAYADVTNQRVLFGATSFWVENPEHPVPNAEAFEMGRWKSYDEEQKAYAIRRFAAMEGVVIELTPLELRQVLLMRVPYGIRRIRMESSIRGAKIPYLPEEHGTFQRAILEAPDKVGPLREYGGWLEAHGEPGDARCIYALADWEEPSFELRPSMAPR